MARISLVGFGLGVLLTLMPASLARADLVSYDFTGVLTQVSSSPIGPLPGSVQLGASFTGNITYDDSTPELSNSPVDRYAGQYVGAVANLSITIGSATFSQSTVLIYPDPENDVYIEQHYLNSPSNQYISAFVALLENSTIVNSQITGQDLELDLVDTTDTAYSSTSSLPTSLSLSEFNEPDIYYSIGTTGSYSSSFTGELLTLTPATIPEPSSLALLGLGGCCVAARLARRHFRLGRQRAA